MIDELGGILGLDPGPFSLRELLRMVEAKGRYDWQHTSSLMALIVNLMRNPKKSKPAKPTDFNPYLTHNKLPVIKGQDLKILKDIFVHD